MIKHTPTKARRRCGTLEQAFQEIHDCPLDPKVGHALVNMAKAMVATLGVSKSEYLLLNHAANIEKLEAHVNVSKPSARERVATEMPILMTMSCKIERDEP